MRFFRFPWLWLFGSLLVAGCRPQETFPSRPITILCPWAPGGGSDLVARQAAALLEKDLRVPVNVVNATGGGGVTGHTRGALARGDGYTMTMVTVEITLLHWRGMTALDHRNFAPVALMNEDAAALFVRSDANWTHPGQLTETIRNQPRTVRCSGTAQGGIWHLALASWLQSQGIAPELAPWISINGASPSLQELLAGGVQVVCCSLPEARALLEGGRIRCLGVMASQRLQRFPNVPTFRELGVPWEMSGWRGFAVPKDTPAPIVQSLENAFERIAATDEYRKFLENTGVNGSFSGAAAFRAKMESQDAAFGKLLQSAAFDSLRKSAVSPMAFPVVLAALGCGVLVLLAFTGGLHSVAHAPALGGDGLMRGLEMCAAIALYIALAETTGFILAATLILGILLWRLQTRPLTAFAIAVSVTIPSYYVFATVLRVGLPRGWLGW